MIQDLFFRYIVKWITEDQQITSCERAIVLALKVLGILFFFIQVAALVTGSFFIFINFADVTYDSKYKPSCTEGEANNNEDAKNDGKVYCDFSLFTFGFCLVTMVWICLVIGAASIITVLYGQWSRKEDGPTKLLHKIKRDKADQMKGQVKQEVKDKK